MTIRFTDETNAAKVESDIIDSLGTLGKLLPDLDATEVALIKERIRMAMADAFHDDDGLEEDPEALRLEMMRLQSE